MATRTKRILSVQATRDGGGSETALVRLIRELGADGWECHVALPSPPRLAEEYVAAGAVLHLVPMQRLTLSGSRLGWLIRYLLGWPGSVLRLARLARRLHVDVVHTNSLHCLHGWAAATLARRPHVWHAREIVAQSGAALAVERVLARRFATTVIAASQAVADQLHPDNVVVVFDRPDTREFTPRRAGGFRAGIGVTDEALLIGAACRIDTWKGVDVLLDAFALLRVDRPDLQAVVAGGPVVGKEDYEARLRARAGQLGVHWLGPRRDVADMLADLDVFVQVSTLPEPFGLVLAEALASGCPVVATAGGGPVEILAHVVAAGTPPGEPSGHAGRLVPFTDPAATAAAIVELLPLRSSNESRAGRPALIPTLTSGPSLPEIFDAIYARVPTRR